MHRPSIPLSLYIHLPWCIRKCPYCDFNSHEFQGALPESDYVEALLRDLEMELPQTDGRPIETIFIGGGTPSLFSAKAIDDLLEGVRHRVCLAKNAEVTLEANPGACESVRFEGYLKAGVNRLSIGIQSFQDRLLNGLGRIHDQKSALAAVKIARDAGFSELNIDLMFGLQGQTTEMALLDIETAIHLDPTHLSFYQLTLEPNTFFFKYPPSLPNEDVIFTIQTQCQERLEANGYQQYEVSAYAREGSRCRHNLNYWEFGDYIGIGAGAHGKITDLETLKIQRSSRIKHPGHYLQALKEGRTAKTIQVLEPRDVPFEFLMNGLRLRSGCSLETLRERTGASVDLLQPSLEKLIDDELIERSGTQIRCSSRGYNFLDTILQRLLPS